MSRKQPQPTYTYIPAQPGYMAVFAEEVPAESGQIARVVRPVIAWAEVDKGDGEGPSGVLRAVVLQRTTGLGRMLDDFTSKTEEDMALHVCFFVGVEGPGAQLDAEAYEKAAETARHWISERVKSGAGSAG